MLTMTVYLQPQGPVSWLPVPLGIAWIPPVHGRLRESKLGLEMLTLTPTPFASAVSFVTRQGHLVPVWARLAQILLAWLLHC